MQKKYSQMIKYLKHTYEYVNWKGHDGHTLFAFSFTVENKKKESRSLLKEKQFHKMKSPNFN